MHRFDYYAPTTLAEAATLLKERGDGVKLLAGGTDLLVQMKEAGLAPSAVVSLHALDELRGIENGADGLRIGAGTYMATVASDATVRERYTGLAEGAGIVGSVQTRNMATLGGNVANAAPSADTVPPLIAFDATVEVMGPQGSRTLPVAEIASGPSETTLAREEIITSLNVPAPAERTGSVYQRHTPRKIMDIAAVGVGIRLTLGADDTIADVRIALGAVGPTVMRATDAEAALAGQPASDDAFARAAELAQAAATPISDVRGSAEFRRYLVGVMTKRCLSIAAERARGA